MFFETLYLIFSMRIKSSIFFVVNLGTLLERTVSQIFYLRLSFYFMTKNGILFAFLKILIFLDCIIFDLGIKK